VVLVLIAPLGAVTGKRTRVIRVRSTEMTPELLRWPENSSTIESLEIHWPSGRVERVRVPAVDRIFTVEKRRGITAEFASAAKQTNGPDRFSYCEVPYRKTPCTTENSRKADK
jgi:hypothetical protein